MPDVGYWAGNEPDILAPWLFVFGGCAYHTQYWTRWLVDHKYSALPDGIPGNDDYGTMSAWLVFASLGFYPLSGAPLYIIGSPSLQVSHPDAVLRTTCSSCLTTRCLSLPHIICLRSTLRWQWSR